MNLQGWRNLTPAEAQVAELAMQGLTNPEIGQRLEISKRTVGAHLSKVFAKLGLRSRIDLILHGAEIRAVTKRSG